MAGLGFTRIQTGTPLFWNTSACATDVLTVLQPRHWQCVLHRPKQTPSVFIHILIWDRDSQAPVKSAQLWPQDASSESLPPASRPRSAVMKLRDLSVHLKTIRIDAAHTLHVLLWVSKRVSCEEFWNVTLKNYRKENTQRYLVHARL